MTYRALAIKNPIIGNKREIKANPTFVFEPGLFLTQLTIPIIKNCINRSNTLNTIAKKSMNRKNELASSS